MDTTILLNAPSDPFFFFSALVLFSAEGDVARRVEAGALHDAAAAHVGGDGSAGAGRPAPGCSAEGPVRGIALSVALGELAGLPDS